jgi:hypothetical protein
MGIKWINHDHRREVEAGESNGTVDGDIDDTDKDRHDVSDSDHTESIDNDDDDDEGGGNINSGRRVSAPWPKQSWTRQRMPKRESGGGPGHGEKQWPGRHARGRG